MKVVRSGGPWHGAALVALILGACAETPTSVRGGQDQFVRLETTFLEVSSDTLTAYIQLKNLTLQPFNTLDGMLYENEGLRVFFVREPNDGVTIANPSGAAAFLESRELNYFVFPPDRFVGPCNNGILMPGCHGSGGTPWKFALDSATKFTFRVLVWTKVPDPTAYSTVITRLAAAASHTCGEGQDGNAYCWGANEFNGQLGIGYTGPGSDKAVPTRVLSPPGVSLTNIPVAVAIPVPREVTASFTAGAIIRRGSSV